MRCLALRHLAFEDLGLFEAGLEGTHALALQFHPEVNPACIEACLIGHTVELAQASVDVTLLRAQAATFGRAPLATAAAVLTRWLNGWR